MLGEGNGVCARGSAVRTRYAIVHCRTLSRARKAAGCGAEHARLPIFLEPQHIVFGCGFALALTTKTCSSKIINLLWSLRRCCR